MEKIKSHLIVVVVLIFLGSCGSGGSSTSAGRHFNCNDMFAGNYEVQSSGTCHTSGGNFATSTSGTLKLYCDGAADDQVFAGGQRVGIDGVGTWRETSSTSVIIDEGQASEATWTFQNEVGGVEEWFSVEAGGSACDQGLTIFVVER